MLLEKEEMKFIVLYALKQYKAPMTRETFFEIITWDKEIMGFFDASGALYELETADYIKSTFYRNEECFALTENGERALELFGEKFPRSIQKRLDDAIGKLRYETLSAPDASFSEILPVNHSDYAARLTYMEDHTPMLELSLNAGSRKNAEAVARYLKENSKEIYEKILNLCVPEE